VAIDAIREIPGLLNDPAPFVTFGKFGGSAIEFSLFYWLDMEIVDLSEGQTRGFKALKDAFYQAGIEMPFPTQKILMDKN
jgi:small-conductance mechanosensitive channel